MKTHKETNEQLAGFVLGELSQEQTLAVKKHLAECEQCRDELERLQTLLEHTGHISKTSVDEVTCESVKQSLFATIENEETKNQTAGSNTGPAFIWRTIMKSKITRLAAAAVIITAVLAGINYFGGSIDGAGVAWADVATRAAQVNYVHFYHLDCYDDGFTSSYEGWYAHGKCFGRGRDHTSYDDGEMLQGFDRHNTRCFKLPSMLGRGQSFLELASRGLLSENNEQFDKQIPVSVGDDFLLYKFDPPEEDSNWIESISVMVGRNSLLPVQIKIYYKYQEGNGGTKKRYLLAILDYEAPEKPAEFFEPPSVSMAPHGIGKVVLDGEEVMIDISNVPGIKAAVVRLHDKSTDNTDKPTFSLDTAFITEEGFRSITNDLIRLKLNEGRKCGVGADNWPDGKYRNISFTPVLKGTEQEDVYLIEISCWLRTNEIVF